MEKYEASYGMHSLINRTNSFTARKNNTGSSHQKVIFLDISNFSNIFIFPRAAFLKRDTDMQNKKSILSEAI